MNTDSSPLGDVSPDEFRKAAHTAVEWVADYLENPARYPVRSQVAPGDVKQSLPASPPQHGESLAQMMDDFETKIVPGITHWNNPAFFAYFSITGSYPGIIGELLTAGLNVNGMLWASSPSVTELEEVTLSWLRQLMGLKGEWYGEILDTASMSTFYALAAAREALNLDVRTRGLAGRTDIPVLRVYCSEHAHSSIDKAVMALGLGHENCVKIGTDADFRLRPDVLRAAIERDIAAGFLPMAIVATVGTTSVSSIDPIAVIAPIAKEFGCWLHVDGAYGGSAAVVPELRYLLDGTELADSLVVNPHKWLFTPVDCSVLYIKRPELLKAAFALLPEYLITSQADSVMNLMDYGIQLGRRFRSLKLWMVMRAFGAEGLAQRIRFHCELAREFAGMVYYEGNWQVMAPVTLSLVCFRYAAPDMSEDEIARINSAVMERVNSTGRTFLSHTKVDGRYMLRLAIGNIRTGREHITLAWRELRSALHATLTE